MSLHPASPFGINRPRTEDPPRARTTLIVGGLSEQYQTATLIVGVVARSCIQPRRHLRLCPSDNMALRCEAFSAAKVAWMLHFSAELAVWAGTKTA
jgi:hypothetical protein